MLWVALMAACGSPAQVEAPDPCAAGRAAAARVGEVSAEEAAGLRAPLEQAVAAPGCEGRADMLAALGVVAERGRDMDEARRRFSEALAVDPTRLDAQVALGALLAATPETSLAAEPWLVQALATAPDHPVVLRGLGRVELARGNPRGALAWLQRAAAVQQDAESTRDLATARLAAGDAAGARAIVVEGMRRYPQDQGIAGLWATFDDADEKQARALDDRARAAREAEHESGDDALDLDALGAGAAVLERTGAVEQATVALGAQLNDAAAKVRLRGAAGLGDVLEPRMDGWRDVVSDGARELTPGVEGESWRAEGPAPMDRAQAVAGLASALGGLALIEDLRVKIAASDLEADGSLSGTLKGWAVGRDGQGRRVRLSGRARFSAERSGERWSLTELVPTELGRMRAEREMFVQVAAEAGLGCTPPFAPTAHLDNNISYGAAAGDLDGDGRVDAVVLGRDRAWAWRNQGDGTFRDVAPEAGLRDVGRGRHLTSPLLVDMDDDGDLDLVIGAYGPTVVLRNERVPTGRLVFVDVTEAAGVPQRAWSLGIAAADVNGDGHEDVYVSSYHEDTERRGVRASDPTNAPPNLLLLSHGDGTFEEAGERWGVADRRWTVSSAFADLDGDGDPDLVVANDFGGGSTAYRNDGDRFTDVGAAWGIADRAFGMSAEAGDVDNDGDLDVLLTNMSSTAGARILARLGADEVPERSVLVHQAAGSALLRKGGGRFTDVTAAAGPFHHGWAWGSHLADLDNDGWLDLHVPNGFLSGADVDDT